MKIVEYEEFIRLPSGTVFAHMNRAFSIAHSK